MKLLRGARQFCAYDRGAGDHGFEFSKSGITRQVFHAAIGSENDVLGGDIGQRAANAPNRIFLYLSGTSALQSSFDCAVSTDTWRQLQPASSGRNE